MTFFLDLCWGKIGTIWCLEFYQICWLFLCWRSALWTKVYSLTQEEKYLVFSKICLSLEARLSSLELADEKWAVPSVSAETGVETLFFFSPLLLSPLRKSADWVDSRVLEIFQTSQFSFTNDKVHCCLPWTAFAQVKSRWLHPTPSEGFFSTFFHLFMYTTSTTTSPANKPRRRFI